MHYAGIGSRETPPDVQEEMTEIASWLLKLGFVLRSGGADGADKAFERGAGKAKQIFHARDCTAEAEAIASIFHPAWHRCSPHARKLLGRNSFQIMGLSLIEPSLFVVCWTRNGSDEGGTGNAIRHAWSEGIPVFNLRNDGDREKLASHVSALQSEKAR